MNDLHAHRWFTPDLPIGKDGVLRNKLLLFLIAENGVWWISEFHNVAQKPKIEV